MSVILLIEQELQWISKIRFSPGILASSGIFVNKGMHSIYVETWRKLHHATDHHPKKQTCQLMAALIEIYDTVQFTYFIKD